MMSNIMPYLGWGILHEQNGTPCQDAIAYRFQDNGTLVAALSDGASKAKYAQRAAVRTAKSIRDFFERTTLSDFMLWGEAERKKALLDAVRKKLREDEFFLNRDAPEFSATALFVVIDEATVAFGHLGDGAIYALNQSGELAYSSEPENNGGSSKTWFGVSQDAEKHLRIDCAARRDISCVILLSDGPYLMFHNLGNGNASMTARKLMNDARSGTISRSADLRKALNQMADIPSERLDDWSIILWNEGQERETNTEYGMPVVSMLGEEEEKSRDAADAPRRTGGGG